MAGPGKPAGDLTQMLDAAASGDADAASHVFPIVYQELRAMAEAQLRQQPVGHTLQPTALVHEVYLRLLGGQHCTWQTRSHFFFAAARAMRDILVENARRKTAQKRGGGSRRIDADSLTIAFEAPPEEMLALNHALERLERDDSRKHQLVMLRFFAGLTTEEAATSMGISARTAERDWRFVKARLHRELACFGDSNGTVPP